MCNKDVREYDGNFSRRLRTELSEDKKAEIFKIIDELAAE